MCTIFKKLTIVCYDSVKIKNLLEKKILTNKCLLRSLKKQMFVTRELTY